MITDLMKEVLYENVCYFGTVSKDGRPNVIPMGLVEGVDDDKIVLVDVMFEKTKQNLVENNKVSLAVTDFKRKQSYQFKGIATVYSTGVEFELAQKVIDGEIERRKKIGLEIDSVKEWIPKSVVIIKVEEFYSNM